MSGTQNPPKQGCLNHSHYIQQGKVLFPPDKGAEELVMQMAGFNVETQDDLADAFSLLLLKNLEKDGEPVPSLTIIDFGSSMFSGFNEFRHKPLTMNTIF